MAKGSFLDRVLEAAADKYGEKVTQAGVGKLIGVSQPSVYLWRTGFPKIENGVRIAHRLGVCVEWLYTGEGPKHPWDQMVMEDRKLDALLKLWNSLNETSQDGLLAAGAFIKQSGGAIKVSGDNVVIEETQGKQEVTHPARRPKPPGVDKSKARRSRAA